MQNKFKITNMHTGEVIDQVPLYVARKHKVAFKEFMFINQKSWMELAKGDFDGNTFRVLFALLDKVSFGNKIDATQRDVAESIGMDVSNFTRYVTRLVKAGILVKDEKSGRNQGLELSDSFGWRGSAKSHIDQVHGKKKDVELH